MSNGKADGQNWIKKGMRDNIKRETSVLLQMFLFRTFVRLCLWCVAGARKELVLVMFNSQNTKIQI